MNKDSVPGVVCLSDGGERVFRGVAVAFREAADLLTRDISTSEIVKDTLR